MPERVWVITGTNSGFGLAIARYALAQGDKVIGTVRSLEKFPASLKDFSAQPIVLDLNDSDETLKQAAESAIRIYGRVDVLVNNAGTNSAIGPVEELKLDNIRRQFQENLFGIVAFTQPFIAHFRVRRSGHIINISSMASHMNHPSLGAYCASKSAIDSFSESLAKEVSMFGVRVHIIEPGYFPTNIFVTHPNYTPGNASLQHVPVAPGLSKIYTDTAQGYNVLNIMPRMGEATGRVGDVDVLARRVYEVVTDTGMARELEVNERPRLRIPLGSDSGEGISSSLKAAIENHQAIEPIWRSTDIKRAKL
ncbi:NAD-P-binding protein [Irpex rosettiformis]|uniref:NAD-P-binding protein n=1 Tax=Irpex rosettiformis TaxID=378272 RepID=A0ACB8U924_9APHY|nr:NAD-P-binding protein [Irpex rosettiformis]